MGRQAIGDALIACLRTPSVNSDAEVTRLLTAVDPKALVEAADRHGIEGWVRAAAMRASIPDLVARLEHAFLRSTLIRAQMRADLSAVADACDAASVPWLTFKGPVLDEAIHQPPRLRAYNDLDLLVTAVNFDATIHALEAAGAIVLDRNWVRIEQRSPGALHLELANGSVADLHWHVLEAVDDRRRFSIDTTGILNRASNVEVFGRQVPTMDPVDTIVFTALHAASHGASRLLWLKDVEQCIVRYEPDWDKVIVRAREWRVALAVSTVLARTSHALGLDVPRSVLRSLGYTPPWSLLAGTSDRFAPIQRSSRGRSFARIVAAASGRDQRESMTPLAERVVRALRHPMNMPPPAPSRDPNDPASPLYPSGGVRERNAYLANIAREDLLADLGRGPA